MPEMKGDWTPVARESGDSGRQLSAKRRLGTWYLVLDAGGEETEAGGRGMFELKMMSHVGKR